MTTTALTLFTDGGARGNPGPSGIGVSVVNQDNQEVYAYGEAIGVATNNEAEYLAFLHSVSWVTQQELAPNCTITWKLDSQLVVEQLNKRWKVKDARMRGYAEQAWKMLSTLPYSMQIIHIRRAENKRADALVNQALDQA